MRHRAALEPSAFVQVGVDAARPAPGVTEAFASADAVLLAPSNPVVSIGTILGVPGLREALLASPGRIAGVSPIVGGAVVRGMADRCLPALGIEVSAEGVGRHYGARSDGGLLDAWLVAPDDAADVPGVDVRRVPLLMSVTGGDGGPGPRRPLRRRCLSVPAGDLGPAGRRAARVLPGRRPGGGPRGRRAVAGRRRRRRRHLQGRVQGGGPPRPRRARRRPRGRPAAGDRRARPCGWSPAGGR